MGQAQEDLLQPSGLFVHPDDARAAVGQRANQRRQPFILHRRQAKQSLLFANRHAVLSKRRQSARHIQHAQQDIAPAVALQIPQRPFKEHFAVMNDADLRHHLLHFAEQMARNEHRRARRLRHGCNQAAHFLNACRIEAVGWLIQDQQARSAQQRRRDAQPLFHAQRILAHPAVRVARQAHDIQHAVNLPVAHALQIADDGQILPCRQMQIAGRRFDQAARFPKQLDAAFLVQLPPQQLHAAARGTRQPQHHLHAGRFARAVRPQKAVDTPMRHVQIQMIDDAPPVIRFAQVPRPDSPLIFHLHQLHFA